MRAAPAVDAALGSGRLERLLITLLYGATGAALALWGAGHAEWTDRGPTLAPGLAAVAAASVMAATGAWLARRVLPPGPARLVWDGSTWQLRGDRSTAPSRLVVALDLGHWVLLELAAAEGRSTLWRVARARSCGADWHGLRVALQAHAGDAQPRAGSPGASR
ncbi:MAG: hypothetical protein JNL87_07015 [Burkholderiaceae bacterium]|nr:hypothetical protein [Burkholderiaceae bacterium]